ncbi:MAG: hypothetical protein ABI206_15495 [Antricoccus sp.]
MTWSVASPDGRATFEMVAIYNQLRCRWWRVRDHAVFWQPKVGTVERGVVLAASSRRALNLLGAAATTTHRF